MKRLVLQIVLLISLVSSNSAYASPAQVEKFVQKVSDQVVSIISSKAFSDKDKEVHLRTIFLKNVDVVWISKFVMGRYWRDATKLQRLDYRKWYEEYLLQSYIPKFRAYTNQKLAIKRVLKQSEDEYLVETNIVDDSAQPIRVDYKVRKIVNGEKPVYMVFDVIAEGISLITTQRSEFGSILSREGIASLISKIRMKVESSS